MDENVDEKNLVGVKKARTKYTIIVEYSVLPQGKDSFGHLKQIMGVYTLSVRESLREILIMVKLVIVVKSNFLLYLVKPIQVGIQYAVDLSL